MNKPEIKSGQVLIQVKAFGMNPIDWKLRSGVMKAFLPLPLPFILGSEVSGVVTEISKEIQHFKVGDHVYGRTQHTYAEYVTLDENNAQIIP